MTLQSLLNLISFHKRLLNSATNISEKISQISKENILKIDLISNLTEERERIVGIITTVQNEIEQEISKLPIEVVTDDLIKTFREWNENMNDKIKMINNFDQVIISNLEEKKRVTADDISNTFQNKEKFKGYNLQCVKK